MRHCQSWNLPREGAARRNLPLRRMLRFDTRPTDLATRYDFNEVAASVTIYAIRS